MDRHQMTNAIMNAVLVMQRQPFEIFAGESFKVKLLALAAAMYLVHSNLSGNSFSYSIDLRRNWFAIIPFFLGIFNLCTQFGLLLLERREPGPQVDLPWMFIIYGVFQMNIAFNVAPMNSVGPLITALLMPLVYHAIVAIHTSYYL